MIYAFGAYTLDTDRYELRRGGTVCPLEPHALDILTYFLQHRDRVVTKRELLEQLWPGRFVGEGILAQRMMTIRKAIGDSGQTQQCIKTIHGRGYRFAAEVTVQSGDRGVGFSPTNGTSDQEGRGPTLFTRPPHFVGRDAELARLVQWWRTAQQGMRQVGFIVGEPGIGKTALVDAFVAQVAAGQDLSLGCGQCVDDYGMGEAYRPLLEALGRLCREAGGDRLVAALREYAPSWLVHLHSAIPPADTAALARPTDGVTPAQMLRELTDALEAFTIARPVVLVLEDLHWSDRATLAWLAYMARKRDSARILILGTYRPNEVLGRAHPLRALLADLRPHHQCAELVLDALSAPVVATYLSDRCGGMLPAPVPALIHHRTGGHPLFLVSLVDELVRERHFGNVHDAAAAREQLAALSDIVPTNLRAYIEEHLERLSPQDRALLDAASVAGMTFTVAAVAAPTADATKRIEGRYSALARQGRFIRAHGIETWPDGTTTACYQFKHGLYQEVAYARVSAGRRRLLHQQIGLRKERGYAAQTPQIATELAVHFVRGGDTGRAVQYLDEAADIALQRSAYQEAISHLTQGLEWLTARPDAAGRDQFQLRFLTKLGLAFVATRGQAHVDVQTALARARVLCHQLSDSSRLFQVLGGLLSFHIVRSELSAARQVADQLSSLAEREPDSTRRLVAHWAFGQTLLFQGDFAPASAQLEQGIELYDRNEHHDLGLRAGFPGDLGVFCCCVAAHTRWHLGYPDQAVRYIEQALTLAQELTHPYSRALALAYAAMLYQFRRQTHLARAAAETAIGLCQEQGFAYYLAWVTIIRGWTLTMQEHAEEGRAEMQRGLGAIGATGARLRHPYYLALLAEAHAQTGESAAAVRMLGEGLAAAHHDGECWHEAELYRLHGEVLVGSPDSQAGRSQPVGCPTVDRQVEGWFHEAMATARRQQAKSVELRAATSLARLWTRQGKRAEAYEMLAPIYHWFTEGFDTPDMQDAAAMLTACASPA